MAPVGEIGQGDQPVEGVVEGELLCAICNEQLDGVDEKELPCGCLVHKSCAFSGRANL